MTIFLSIHLSRYPTSLYPLDVVTFMNRKKTPHRSKETMLQTLLVRWQVTITPFNSTSRCCNSYRVSRNAHTIVIWLCCHTWAFIALHLIHRPPFLWNSLAVKCNLIAYGLKPVTFNTWHIITEWSDENQEKKKWHKTIHINVFCLTAVQINPKWKTVMVNAKKA